MRSYTSFLMVLMGLIFLLGCGRGSNPVLPREAEATFNSKMVALGYNDLGMHCMNQDFSELAILPPFNNLYAQVILRGDDPTIVTSGVTVNYSFPGNTHSADKTNFWTYLHNLGIQIPNNIGLTGNGLSGTMSLATGRTDWVATGIPITPKMDSGALEPYPLATIRVTQSGAQVALTYAVAPVSWEISCNLCHNTPGISPALDILRRHDQMHGTSLEFKQPKPVLCGGCHRQEPLTPLGLVGKPGIESLSRAMHHAHASRMAPVNNITGGVTCYACHPGIQTQCLRDIHKNHGFTCYSCHSNMNAVASLTRHPWIDEPRCVGCHSKPGFQYEQPNTLYRNSIGHMGVHCEACHGSPHAIYPTTKPNDNVQANFLQGHAGTIDTCIVCHTQLPDDAFIHRVSDD